MQFWEEITEEVKLNELPTALINYYIIVDHQAEKLAQLIKLLNSDCLESKTIVFFSTCASVEYHSYIMPLICPDW